MIFPAYFIRFMIGAFSGAMAAAALSSACNAAVIVPGEFIEVSGKSNFAVEMTVMDYFFSVAPAAGARNIGHRDIALFNLAFTGYVDDTRTSFPFTDAQYNFSNGWVALVNGPPSSSFETPCGLVINFCVGELAGADYWLVQSDYDLTYTLVIEGANPINGDPVNWFFSEEVIFENRSNPDDFHVFSAGGRSVPTSVIPLPSTLGLMFAAAACTAGLLRRRRRFA